MRHERVLQHNLYGMKILLSSQTDSMHCISKWWRPPPPCHNWVIYVVKTDIKTTINHEQLFWQRTQKQPKPSLFLNRVCQATQICGFPKMNLTVQLWFTRDTNNDKKKMVRNLCVLENSVDFKKKLHPTCYVMTTTSFIYCISEFHLKGSATNKSSQLKPSVLLKVNSTQAVD